MNKGEAINKRIVKFWMGGVTVAPGDHRAEFRYVWLINPLVLHFFLFQPFPALSFADRMVSTTTILFYDDPQFQFCFRTRESTSCGQLYTKNLF